MSEEERHVTEYDDVNEDEREIPFDEYPYRVPARYFDALGRFSHTFAEAETALRDLLQSESDIDTKVFRVVYDNAPVGKLINNLEDIRKARAISDTCNISAAISQLSVISQVRNAILHNGVRSDENARLYALRGGKLPPTREINASPEILTAMQEDLIAIQHCFCARIIEKQALGTQNDIPEVFSAIFDSVQKCASSPWQYKPSQGNRM
ncbi:hypothetical protein C0V97_00915 [Asaia sp. W19]|uniref:hypothetical protein n=1 Tax=unclassified Asaia TaxID=2685023 RepID=UPI000F8C6F14|nr:hypothetical protein [Asaia sp. W19]RUT27360.1 hypothetical protein C0V97_00915 [Asaia sp. W19]